MKAQSCKNEFWEQSGRGPWQTFAASGPMRHLFVHWDVWTLSWVSLRTRRLRWKWTLLFQKFLLVKTTTQTLCLTSQWGTYYTLSFVFLCNKYTFFSKPWLLRLWKWKKYIFSWVISLQRYEDKLQHPQSTLRSGVNHKDVQIASQLKSAMVWKPAEVPYQTGSIQ